MTHWPLGVFTSLDSGRGISLDVLTQLRIPTIQLHAPQLANRTEAFAVQLMNRLQELKVTTTCVFAGFAGESYVDISTVRRTVGLAPLQTRANRVVELKGIADFAASMQVMAVGLHLGCIPPGAQAAGYSELLIVTREVADYCASRSQAIHLETGQESAAVLERFLQDVDRPNVFVNFDPANMILYGCGEPIDALRQIGCFVRSVHCKDACWSAEPGVTWGTELPLGEGAVDFNRFLKTLAEIGYTGPLTIEREIPEEPARQLLEIGQGMQFLQRLMQTR